ncbi:MAG: Asp23/Gls24 family envelope stress response protein [Firmicutes bacterium]|nr:Asp23/Gls24 family envelope stress response protein [Bacillota bacterium]MDY5676948.1 Asp23/Gls24 family envelope stress response protein [Eubacteriales bacterium]
MMYDNKSNIKKQAKGNVTYGSNIVLSVINLATKEIAGVSSIVTKFSSALKRWFSNNYYEGVKVTYNKDAMNVDVYINVCFGYNVTEVAYRVQENIKNSLSGMIDIKINRINVHVLGVEFPKDELI